MAKNVHQLKEKLDKRRYRDRTTRVYLSPCILQLGKHTHTHKKDIKKIEGIQRAATKMAPSLRNLPYEEKLSKLKLPTFEKRRER